MQTVNRINNIYDSILAKKIGWVYTLFLWGCSGIVFMFFLMKSRGLINVDSTMTTFTTIGTLITAGLLYGLISNLIVGFLIKLTGHFFKASNDLRKIYRTLAKSYFPYIFFVILILTNIYLARILMTSSDQIIKLSLTIIVILIIFGQVVLGISQWILLFKGLKKTQGLNSLNTILNYFSSTLIFGGLYYFLLEPYL